MIEAKFKKNGSRDLTTPIRAWPTWQGYIFLAFDIFYMHTKFGVSRFSRSGNVTLLSKMKMGHVTLTTPLLKVI